MTSMFEWTTPPQEWLDDERKKSLVLVASASIGPAEPSDEQRTQAAIARTLLWFGSRIEALEKRRVEPLQDGGEREQLTVEVVRADKVQIGHVLLTRDFASIVVGQINSYPFDFYSQGGSAPFLRCELPETPVLRLVARHPHQDVERHEREDFVRGWSEGWQCAGLKADGTLPPQSEIREALTFAGFSDELIDTALAPSPDDRGGER